MTVSVAGNRPVSEFTRRVLFTIVAVPVAIGVLYGGDWMLAGALAILSALGAWEFFRIAEAAGHRPLERWGIALAALLPLLAHAHRLAIWRPSFALGTLVVIVLLAASLWARGPTGRPLGAVSTTVLGVIYTGVCFSFAYLLRHHPYTVDTRGGAALVLLPFVLTWTSDTGAYLVGRTMGRRKLMPSVSPGKTVEGSIGGLLLAMIVSWIFVEYVLVPQAQLGMRPGAALLFGILISAAVQLGDLVESMLKREGGVKDSSRLLPGHGGILDRFDGLLFALPVAWVLLDLVLIAAPR